MIFAGGVDKLGATSFELLEGDGEREMFDSDPEEQVWYGIISS